MISQTDSITVAIVEDDAVIRESLRAVLDRTENVECVGEFPCAEEAIARLPSLQPRVVLMDINLPGANGVECVRRLSGMLTATQIVMLTVHEDAEAIFQSLSAGASGYLLKPVSVDELRAAIRDVFSGGAPMTSYIARKVVQSFKNPAPVANETESLAPREQEVLSLLARGYVYKEIAETLGISYATVHTHIRRIYSKLHVRSRSHAVAKYLGHG